MKVGKISSPIYSFSSQVDIIFLDNQVHYGWLWGRIDSSRINVWIKHEGVITQRNL